MLKTRPRTMRKNLKALRDPEPEFVSLVFAGANKTPFRALRADNGKGLIPMPGDTSLKHDAFAVSSIEFSAEHFPSEASVQLWLDEGSYSGAVVAKTRAGWVAQGSGDLPPDVEIQTVDLPDDGVTMRVFEVSPGTPEESSKSENSLRAKFDGCRAAVTSTYTEGREKEGPQDYGPLLLDLTMALYGDMRVALRGGDTAAVKAAVDEFGDCLAEFLDVIPGTDVPSFKAFADAIAPEVDVTKETETSADEAQSVEKDAAVAEVETQEEAPEATADAEATAEDVAEGDEGAESGETAEATPEVAEKEGDAGTAVVTAEEESDEEAAAEEAVAEKSDNPIESLTAAMETLAKSVETLQTTVVERTDSLAERVAAVEETRQTRKGADVDETNAGNTGSTQKSDSEVIEARRTRSVLGMRN